MTREEMAARMEEFRTAYRVSVEAGRRLAEPRERAERVEKRPPLPPALWAAGRRMQGALLREIEAECPRPRVPVRGFPAGSGGQMSPDNFMWRTMGR